MRGNPLMQKMMSAIDRANAKPAAAAVFKLCSGNVEKVASKLILKAGS